MSREMETIATDDRSAIRSCPLCGDEEPRFKWHLRGKYTLHECTSCGTRFCEPFAAPSPEFYAVASDLASEARHSGPTKWYPDHPTRRSELFSSGRGGRLLDVGCGNGAFAEFAASVGYEVVGIDQDSVSLDVARSRNIPGATFHRSTLEEFQEEWGGDARIDVVTMFEVFEHLDRPAETLTRIKQLLRPGGVFAGSLPNTSRPLMWRLHMNYEMPPYHLTYWTPGVWRRLLERRFEFEVRRCEATIYYGYASDVLTYRYRLPRLLRTVVSRVLYPIEYKLEKTFEVGASFYFEAYRGE
jgi:SAM-dependent methyltransferase